MKIKTLDIKQYVTAFHLVLLSMCYSLAQNLLQGSTIQNKTALTYHYTREALKHHLQSKQSLPFGPAS